MTAPITRDEIRFEMPRYGRGAYRIVSSPEHGYREIVTQTGPWTKTTYELIPELWEDICAELSAEALLHARRVWADRKKTLEDPRWARIAKALGNELGEEPTEIIVEPPKLVVAHLCEECGRKYCTKSDYGLPGFMAEHPARLLRFCSDRCDRIEYRRRTAENMKRTRPSRAYAELHPVACEVCGESFIAKRKDARYCGPTCRQRARRGRNAD